MTERNSDEKIFKLVLRYRFLILFILLAATLFISPNIFKLDISADMDAFFTDNDPKALNQAEFKKLFGNDEFIGVLVESDDVFSDESLELIQKLGEKLKNTVPFAAGISSIATDNLPSISKRLFSKDRSEALILLSLDNYPGAEDWHEGESPRHKAGRIAWETVQAFDISDIRLTATGIPVYSFRKDAEMMEEMFRVLIIGLITSLAVSIVIIRIPQGIIGSILVLAISVISVFGFQAVIGIQIDSSFIAVPVLLCAAVTLAYNLHISKFFIIKYTQYGRRQEAVIYALQQCSRPLLFTAFTTIAALLSFLFVGIRAIQWVGITSALCVFSSYILSITLFPIIMSIGSDSVHRSGRPVKTDRTTSLLLRFAGVTEKYSNAVILIFIGLTIISVLGLSRLEIDFDAEKVMGSKLQHMKDLIKVSESKIAASGTVDLVLKFSPDALRNPGLLKQIADLESEINALESVKQTTSLNSIIREFNSLSHGKSTSYKNIPETDSELRGLLLYLARLSPKALPPWVDNEFSTGRILIELSSSSSNEIENLTMRIEKLADAILPVQSEYYFIGSAYQSALMNQHVSRGLLKSIIVSLILISGLMIILFRSFRIGITAMLPNIFPVLVSGAIMGFAGIPLEFVTMTVAPMIIGLAVDDTVHIVFRLKKETADSADYSNAVEKTFRTVGEAITETTLIFCLTFLVFSVSKINSIVYMGLLSCAGMLTAYLTDIFLTPVLFIRLMSEKTGIKNKPRLQN
ncbi:MAG: MMPL family transporter [Spirochaetales bacterium]|nr:MMPL family transporter [Spirochaetales bacterium]